MITGHSAALYSALESAKKKAKTIHTKLLFKKTLQIYLDIGLHFFSKFMQPPLTITIAHALAPKPYLLCHMIIYFPLNFELL